LQLGEKTRQEILGAHVGKGWIEALNHIYSAAGTILPVAVPLNGSDVSQVSSLDLRIACISAKSGMTRDVDQILRDEVGLLPLSQRLKQWGRQPNRRLTLLPRFLLSEWIRENPRRWISGKKRRVSHEELVT
jgi:hypothetical protein